MRNNKKLGTEFEREMCKYLRRKGYWVHFMSPDVSGAQPFDIIAVKDRFPIVMDCKTAVKPIFPISRLEDNQLMAFELWLKCGNSLPYIAIKHKNQVYLISYLMLKERLKVDLREETQCILEDFWQ